DEQAVGPGLDGDEAERGDRQPVVGAEVVQQAALAAVGQDLVVDVQVDLRRQGFDLEGGLVVDAVGRGEPAAVLAAEAVAEEPAALGQGLVGGGGDLGQVDVAVLEGDDVAGARDAGD